MRSGRGTYLDAMGDSYEVHNADITVITVCRCWCNLLLMLLLFHVVDIFNIIVDINLVYDCLY